MGLIGKLELLFQLSDECKAISEQPKFFLGILLAWQFSESCCNRFLSLLYLRQQLRGIKFEKCGGKGLLPQWVLQIHSSPSEFASRNA